MKKATAITCAFLDIGGVLPTNGWDHHARKRAATKFKLELAEMENRHHLTFDTYEEGKLTLQEYLDRVVFYQKRPCEFFHFLLLRPRPQARRGRLSACAGHRPGASPAGSLYRKHPDVRPNRGRFGDSKHSSNGLQVHVRETGFARIAE